MDTSKCDKTSNSAPGRILRVKHGYNPNSSSMGSMIFILPASLMAVTAGFGIISGLIMAKFIKRERPAGSEKALNEKGMPE